MKNAKDKIKQAWEENPMAVIAIASGTALAVAKVIDAMTAVENSRTWRKEVNRRDRKSNLIVL